MADNTEKTHNKPHSIARRISVAFCFHQKGGVELEALRFANWLDKQGRLGYVFCVCQKKYLVEQVAGHLADHLVFLEFDGVFRFFRSILLALRARLDVSSNALVVHSWHSNWPLKNLLALRIAGFRLFIIEHQWSRKNRMNAEFAARTLTRYVAGHGIAVSSGARNTLKNRGFRDDRIQVIWNGTDTRRFRIDPGQACEYRSAKGISHDTLVFAYLGRLARQKCVGKVIRSFREYIKSSAQPSAQLLIIGDGPEKARLKRSVEEMKIGNCVSFLGWVSEPETVLPAVDILLLMSRVESFPLAVIEAMSCGCAIVCDNLGDIAELTRGLEGVAVLNGRSDGHNITATFVDHYLRNKDRLRSENRQ